MSDRDPSREERERRERGAAGGAEGGATRDEGRGAEGGARVVEPPGYLPPYSPANVHDSFAEHFYRADPTDRRDIQPSGDPRLRNTLAQVRAPYSIADTPGRQWWPTVSRIEVPDDFREWLHTDEEGDRYDANDDFYNRGGHVVPRVGGAHRCPLCVRPRVEDHSHVVYMTRSENSNRADRPVNLNSARDMNAYVNEVEDLAPTPTYGVPLNQLPPDIVDAMHAVTDERHRRIMALHDARAYIQRLHRGAGNTYSEIYNRDWLNRHIDDHTTANYQGDNPGVQPLPPGMYFDRRSLLGDRDVPGDLPRELPPDYAMNPDDDEDADSDAPQGLPPPIGSFP